jgi:hypothetical protein
MEQRDWDLLDQQMRGGSTPRGNGLAGFTVAVVFLVGLVAGGVLFYHTTESVRPMWNNAHIATYFSDGSAPITSR